MLRQRKTLEKLNNIIINYTSLLHQNKYSVNQCKPLRTYATAFGQNIKSLHNYLLRMMNKFRQKANYTQADIFVKKNIKISHHLSIFVRDKIQTEG